MPRPKKSESAAVSKVKVTKIKKPVKKKAPAKKIVTKPKAKPVIIDVIEDDDFNDANFFSDESLAKANLVPLAPKLKKSDNSEIFKVEDEEIDVQKKFFSDLVSEIKTKKAIDLPKESEIKKNRSPKKKISLYSRLAFKFLLLVGILAVLVFYFSFSKLTILVTPQVEAISDTLFLRVGDNNNSVDDAREKVNGSVNEYSVEVNKIYPATGEEALGEEVTGKVILINNYVKDQPLVATTRLLSSDHKLFRLKSAVIVPAGGKIEAEVYADKISPDMAINSAHFTIPGLWAGLQDKIYADSAGPFSYQTSSEKYVKAADLKLALRDVDSLIMAKAKEGQNFSAQDIVLYQIIDSADTETDAQAGDKVDKFTLIIKAKVVAVVLAKQDVEKLATAKLNLLVPDDKELSAFKPESLSYTLESYDEIAKTAAVKASFSGLMILKKNAEIIDREKLVNLNASQIATYLSNYPEIGHYELKFSPSFIKKAPHLIDRIEVKIAK